MCRPCTYESGARLRHSPHDNSGRAVTDQGTDVHVPLKKQFWCGKTSGVFSFVVLDSGHHGWLRTEGVLPAGEGRGGGRAIPSEESEPRAEPRVRIQNIDGLSVTEGCDIEVRSAIGWAAGILTHIDRKDNQFVVLVDGVSTSFSFQGSSEHLRVPEKHPPPAALKRTASSLKAPSSASKRPRSSMGYGVGDRVEVARSIKVEEWTGTMKWTCAVVTSVCEGGVTVKYVTGNGCKFVPAKNIHRDLRHASRSVACSTAPSRSEDTAPIDLTQQSPVDTRQQSVAPTEPAVGMTQQPAASCAAEVAPSLSSGENMSPSPPFSDETDSN